MGGRRLTGDAKLVWAAIAEFTRRNGRAPTVSQIVKRLQSTGRVVRRSIGQLRAEGLLEAEHTKGAPMGTRSDGRPVPAGPRAERALRWRVVRADGSAASTGSRPQRDQTVTLNPDERDHTGTLNSDQRDRDGHVDVPKWSRPPKDTEQRTTPPQTSQRPIRGGGRAAGCPETPTADGRGPEERATVEKLLCDAGVVKAKELAARPDVTVPRVRRVLAQAEREGWGPGLIHANLASGEPVEAADPPAVERSCYAGGESAAVVARDRARRRAAEAEAAAELAAADAIVATIPADELPAVVEAYRKSCLGVLRPSRVPADWRDKPQWVRGVAAFWRKHRDGQAPPTAGHQEGRKRGALGRSAPRTGLGTGPSASGPENRVGDAH